MFDPFPYRDPNRLVTLTIKNLTKSQGITQRDFFFPQEFLALREQNRVLEDIVGYHQSSFFYDDGTGTRQLVGAFVTTDTFDFYGVPPLLGRGITRGDGQPAAAPVFVMNYKMWQEEFEGNAKILGTTFVINDEPRTLVGIMPSGFDKSPLVRLDRSRTFLGRKIRFHYSIALLSAHSVGSDCC
jgi:hypothetical protein